MASSEQIKALPLSYLERDEDRFLSIALQVAAHEARSGHDKIAQELREIVDRARKSAKTAGTVPIARGLKDSSGLLFATRRIGKRWRSPRPRAGACGWAPTSRSG